MRYSGSESNYSTRCEICDRSGEHLDWVELKYTDNVRNAVSDYYEFSDFYENYGADYLCNYAYTLKYDDKAFPMPFSHVIIYTHENDPVTCYNAAEINNVLNNTSFAWMDFYYTSSYGDSIRLNYLYGITINAKKEMSIIDYDNLFTGISYSFDRPIIVAEGLGFYDYGSFLSPYRYENGAYTPYFNTYSEKSGFKFSKPGTYRATYQFYLGGKYDENDVPLLRGARSTDGDFFSNYFYASFAQYFDVADGLGSITVSYLTDIDHPFADSLNFEQVEINGKYYYKYDTTQSLKDNLVTIGSWAFNQKLFDNENDKVFAWTIKDLGRYKKETSVKYYVANTAISGYVTEFNSSNVYLYAVWDSGLEISFVGKSAQNPSETDLVTKRTYYRSTQDHFGQYKVNLNEISDSLNDYIPPEGYVFAGWTGEIFDYKTIVLETSSSYLYRNIFYYYEFEGSQVVSAVFTYRFGIYYSIDDNYSSRHFIKETVDEGDKVSDPDSKMNLTCKVDGYEFKYWAVEIDGVLVEFDLYNDVFTREMADDDLKICLIAVFGEIEDD